MLPGWFPPLLITDACAALAKSAPSAATTAITIASLPTGLRSEPSIPSCCRIMSAAK
jgi:hypothetical protein